MASTTLQLAFALVSATFVLGNPIAASPKPSGSCKSVQPCVSRIQSWSSGTSYCSSLLSIQPKTATTTLPGTTTSTTLPVVSVTAEPSTTYTTVATTVTVCASSSSTPQGNAKRAATTTKTTPSPVPSELKNCIRTNIPKACSCLGLTTTTTTSTVYSDTTVTVTPSPDSTTVTPPAVTSTSTSTSTVTVGVGSGTPTVILTSPTAITQVDSNGNAAQSYDDDHFTLSLPFNVSLYGVSTSAIDVSVNGWIALVQGQSSSSYINSPLPVANNGGSTGLPDVVFAPYWNDLFINTNTPQGLYYQISGSTPGNRNVSVEWYTSLYSNSAGYYHFIATLYEAQPGVATFSYHQANGQRPGNTQRLGTVGVQRYTTGDFAQYSYDTSVAAGTELRYDPVANRFNDVSTVTCPVQDSPAPQRAFAIPPKPKTGH